MSSLAANSAPVPLSTTLPVSSNIRPVGNAQRHPGVLFDEQDGRSLVVDILNDMRRFP